MSIWEFLYYKELDKDKSQAILDSVKDAIAKNNAEDINNILSEYGIKEKIDVPSNTRHLIPYIRNEKLAIAVDIDDETNEEHILDGGLVFYDESTNVPEEYDKSKWDKIIKDYIADINKVLHSQEYEMLSSGEEKIIESFLINELDKKTKQ